MNKKLMSVGDQIRYQETLKGIAYICTGVFSFFDNMICLGITCIFLICAVYLTVKPDFAKKESMDEMALANLEKARANSLTLTQTILCVMSAVFVGLKTFSDDIVLDWRYTIVPLLFIITGAMSFMVGINFRQLERE